MNKKKIIFDFLNQNYIGVMATINKEGKPEAAVLGFGQTEKLELIFGTFHLTRKYQNLKINPLVAWVIGWDEKITVQYEGSVVELFDKERDQLKEVYHQKNSSAKKYELNPLQRYFQVIPSWIRYSDLRDDTPFIFEVSF